MTHSLAASAPSSRKDEGSSRSREAGRNGGAVNTRSAGGAVEDLWRLRGYEDPPQFKGLDRFVTEGSGVRDRMTGSFIPWEDIPVFQGRRH